MLTCGRSLGLMEFSHPLTDARHGLHRMVPAELREVMGAVCSTQQAVDVAGPARKKILLPAPMVLSVKEDDIGDVPCTPPKASRKRRGSVGPSTGAPCILRTFSLICMCVSRFAHCSLAAVSPAPYPHGT